MKCRYCGRFLKNNPPKIRKDKSGKLRVIIMFFDKTCSTCRLDYSTSQNNVYLIRFRGSNFKKRWNFSIYPDRKEAEIFTSTQKVVQIPWEIAQTITPSNVCSRISTYLVFS